MRFQCTWSRGSRTCIRDVRGDGRHRPSRAHLPVSDWLFPLFTLSCCLARLHSNFSDSLYLFTRSPFSLLLIIFPDLRLQAFGVSTCVLAFSFSSVAFLPVGQNPLCEPPCSCCCSWISCCAGLLHPASPSPRLGHSDLNIASNVSLTPGVPKVC